MRLNNFGVSVFSVGACCVKFVGGLCGCASPAEPALMATYRARLATCLTSKLVRSLTCTKRHVINMVAQENRFPMALQKMADS